MLMILVSSFCFFIPHNLRERWQVVLLVLLSVDRPSFVLSICWELFERQTWNSKFMAKLMLCRIYYYIVCLHYHFEGRKSRVRLLHTRFFFLICLTVLNYGAVNHFVQLKKRKEFWFGLKGKYFYTRGESRYIKINFKKWFIFYSSNRTTYNCMKIGFSLFILLEVTDVVHGSLDVLTNGYTFP